MDEDRFNMALRKSPCARPDRAVWRSPRQPEQRLVTLGAVTAQL